MNEKTDKETENEIAVQRRHENKCSACDGTGTVMMHVPIPWSEVELFEDYEEPCPVCQGGREQ
jgi:DnaJ-class molecular chaperone